MPVGLKQPEPLLPIAGVQIATAAAGIRYSDRDDMALMLLAEGSSVSAVFTKNNFCAAPVIIAKQFMAESPTRALLINSGNANAATGELGMRNAQLSCDKVAQTFGLKTAEVLPFSTGVIGEQLNMTALNQGVDLLSKGLSVDNWLSAAKAIMTTDTLPKAVSKSIQIDGETVSITGMVKGSGMINPDMATLLSYVATDAHIDQQVLDVLLHKATAASFNRITVDSDTSTNDALVLIASGQSQASRIESVDSEQANAFYQALEAVMIELATAVIRDGEGATKFVKVSVAGGKTQGDCESIAYAIAHSPLVKTALFASDPNWGRLVMAIGKAPTEHFDVNKIAIDINGVALLKEGQPAEGYTEEQGQAVFSEQEITIEVNLNLGDERYHVWTSDLSHDYVSINADYRS